MGSHMEIGRTGLKRHFESSMLGGRLMRRPTVAGWRSCGEGDPGTGRTKLQRRGRRKIVDSFRDAAVSSSLRRNRPEFPVPAAPLLRLKEDNP
jgi:hypothetical protein